MKIYHAPYHWVLVLSILAALLLTLSLAYGQSSGAAAVFEGRPSMAGAQAGQGAQAGPPQGGIGVQGSQDAERGVTPRKPSALDELRQARRGESVAATTAASEESAANVEAAARPRKEVTPGRDSSLAKDERSSTRKAARAAKRTLSRARHGVSPIDSPAAATPK